MKSVLVSIQPKWVEKICHEIGKENGKPIYEKRIEVRKEKPSAPIPIKCLIYCTYGQLLYADYPNGAESKVIKLGEYKVSGKDKISNMLNGKVIGEFVCDKVYKITPEFGKFEVETQYVFGWKSEQDDSCLTWEDYHSYLGRKKGYGWHITDLKIYDKPKELSEFRKYSEWLDIPITQPPQSWCYVESLGE